VWRKLEIQWRKVEICWRKKKDFMGTPQYNERLEQQAERLPTLAISLHPG
jgi:hypothetical protein